MPTVYYLDRSTTDGLRLYSTCHTTPPDTLSAETWNSCYRQVATVEWHDLDRILTGFSSTGAELAPAFRESELRGIGVGDVVERDNTYFLCTPDDWQQVTVEP